MTACKTEIRSSSRWGSFSLAISRQIWRNRSTLYTNAVAPQPNTFSYNGEGERNTAIRVWHCTRRCSPMRPGRDPETTNVFEPARDSCLEFSQLPHRDLAQFTAI